MKPEFLLICNEHEKRRLIIADILNIGIDDYLSTFYMKNTQYFTCSKSLREILDILPDYFFHISRSCVVNMNEITSIKRCTRKIILSNSSELSVSMRRMKAFNDAFTRQSLSFTR